MSRIALLPDGLINQIAAGEVVERPASVVKELVENALDAGAKTIAVELLRGGRDLIRVVDDGSGMDREDATACLQRHATSKIRTLDDLVQVQTLGFRGEAIASIASVSHFLLRTRPAQLDAGTMVQVDGGVVGEIGDVGCAAGTEIDVRELFYNLPVRRRFLRTAGTELGHCLEAVTRQALAHPEVDFTVKHGGRVVLRAPRVPNRAARARDLLGEAARTLVAVDFEQDGFSVRGLVSPPRVTRAARTGATYLYVNGRFVRDPVLRRGISEAYDGLVPKGRYPVVVLEVQLAAEAVDVNAHPAKTEVRFRDPRDLVRAVADGVRNALSGLAPPAEPVPVEELPLTGTRATWAPPPKPSVSVHPDDDPRFTTNPWLPPPSYERAESAQTVAPERFPTADYVRAPAAPSAGYRSSRVLGLLGGRYVLCEDSSGLVIIDHHLATAALAAHRLAQDIEQGRVVRLDPPPAIDLGTKVIERLADALPSFAITAQTLGPAILAVTEVPEGLSDADLGAALRDLAEEPEVGTLAAHVVTPEPADEDYELRSLLAALDEAQIRGVSTRLANAEIAERFRRR